MFTRVFKLILTLNLIFLSDSSYGNNCTLVLKDRGVPYAKLHIHIENYDHLCFCFIKDLNRFFSLNGQPIVHPIDFRVSLPTLMQTQPGIYSKERYLLIINLDGRLAEGPLCPFKLVALTEESVSIINFIRSIPLKNPINRSLRYEFDREVSKFYEFRNRVELSSSSAPVEHKKKRPREEAQDRQMQDLGRIPEKRPFFPTRSSTVSKTKSFACTIVFLKPNQDGLAPYGKVENIEINGYKSLKNFVRFNFDSFDSNGLAYSAPNLDFAFISMPFVFLGKPLVVLALNQRLEPKRSSKVVLSRFETSDALYREANERKLHARNRGRENRFDFALDSIEVPAPRPEVAVEDAAMDIDPGAIPAMTADALVPAPEQPAVPLQAGPESAIIVPQSVGQMVLQSGSRSVVPGQGGDLIVAKPELKPEDTLDWTEAQVEGAFNWNDPFADEKFRDFMAARQQIINQREAESRNPKLKEQREKRERRFEELLIEAAQMDEEIKPIVECHKLKGCSIYSILGLGYGETDSEKIDLAYVLNSSRTEESGLDSQVIEQAYKIAKDLRRRNTYNRLYEESKTFAEEAQAVAPDDSKVILEKIAKFAMEHARTGTSIYKIFAIDSTATESEINRNYRQLALTCHPDCPGGKTLEAEQNFERISFFKSVLLLPERRTYYDDQLNLAVGRILDSGDAELPGFK